MTSVKVTGDVACGPAGGGVFGKAGALYDRPVRPGVEVGDGAGVGCWQMTVIGARANNNNPINDRKEIACVESLVRFDLRERGLSRTNGVAAWGTCPVTRSLGSNKVLAAGVTDN